MDITLEFLRDLLKVDYPDVIIEEFESVPATNRGENYISMVYRINLKGTKKLTEPGSFLEIQEPWNGSIIYKCLPESIARRKAFKNDELFENETVFYNKVWLEMSSFQISWKIDIFKAIPKCYLATNDYIFLEDLKEYGFVTPDRRRGLTTAECYAALKSLAQFHALSMALKYRDPEKFFQLIDKEYGIKEVLFKEENREFYRHYYLAAMQNAINMVEEGLKDSDKKDFYMEKFRRFCSEKKFFQMMSDLVIPREPSAVICHGDGWTTNFLFRYNDGKIVETYLLDFQLARYGSLALDVVFLVFLCLDRDQRREHLDSMLQSYADEVCDMLGKTCDQGLLQGALHRDRVNELIHEEFKRCAPFGLGMSLDRCPIITCDIDEAPNVYQTEDTIETTQPMPPVLPVTTSSAACRKKLTDLVQEFVDLKFIN